MHDGCLRDGTSLSKSSDIGNLEQISARRVGPARFQVPGYQDREHQDRAQGPGRSSVQKETGKQKHQASIVKRPVSHTSGNRVGEGTQFHRWERRIEVDR